jgi:leucine-rich PPR motif-containing protein
VKLDVAAYNVLISGLCADGDIHTAFELYEEMKQRDLWPNTSIYVVLIDSICAGNYHTESEKLLRDLQNRELMSLDLSGGGTERLNELLMIARKELIHMRCKTRRQYG